MSGRAVVVSALVALLALQGCQRARRGPGAQAPTEEARRAAAREEVGATAVAKSAPEVDYRLDVTFGKELLLVGFSVSPFPIPKGESATLESVWKCLAKPSRNWVTWTYVTYLGSPRRQLTLDHSPATPIGEWQPGQYYIDPLSIVIPKDFKGGPYEVSLGLYAGAIHLAESLAPGSQRTAEVGVAFSREEMPRVRGERREPRVAQRLSVAFGDELLLVGHSVDPNPVVKGKPATLEIVWKCLARPSRDWVVWTHIGPSQMINRDHRSFFPIVMWEAGKYYRDSVEFTMPAGAKPGQYPVSIGPYASAGRGQPTLLLPEKVMQGGKRIGAIEVGFSGGR